MGISIISGFRESEVVRRVKLLSPDTRCQEMDPRQELV